MKDFYKNKKILITGGLGFIGSNLAIKLVEEGADVMIVDALIPSYGGNHWEILNNENFIWDLITFLFSLSS